MGEAFGVSKSGESAVTIRRRRQTAACVRGEAAPLVALVGLLAEETADVFAPEAAIAALRDAVRTQDTAVAPASDGVGVDVEDFSQFSDGEHWLYA